MWEASPQGSDVASEASGTSLNHSKLFTLCHELSVSNSKSKQHFLPATSKALVQWEGLISGGLAPSRARLRGQVGFISLHLPGRAGARWGRRKEGREHERTEFLTNCMLIAVTVVFRRNCDCIPKIVL